MSSICIGVGIMSVMLIIAINPAKYIESAMLGLVVFSHNVLPSLFPFFFFTRILTSIGMATSISILMRKPVCLLYNSHEVGGYILMMSLISGYPIGAKLLSDLYQSHILTHDDVMRIMPFTSMAGPIFLIGTIGTTMLGNTDYGYILLASSVLGGLLNGVIYRRRTKPISASNQEFRPLNIDNVLNDAINSSIISILVVGGYIVIFYLLGDVLDAIGVISILGNIINVPLSAIGVTDNIGHGVALSLVEMTRGIMDIATISNDVVKVSIIAGLVSLGGLSITIQSMTYLSQAKIKVSYYLLTKLTQSIITTIIALLLMLIVY